MQMRKNFLYKYKSNLRIYSIIAIAICLIMTTIFSVGLYISSVQSEMEDPIKNIVLYEEIMSPNLCYMLYVMCYVLSVS